MTTRNMIREVADEIADNLERNPHFYDAPGDLVIPTRTPFGVDPYQRASYGSNTRYPSLEGTPWIIPEGMRAATSLRKVSVTVTFVVDDATGEVYRPAKAPR